MASRRASIQEDITVRTLRLIGENPCISHRQLATRIGISVGAAHYCLSTLARRGLIKRSSFSASGSRQRCAYLLTPDGVAAKAQLTMGFLERKLTEYEALRVEIAELEREVGATYNE